MIGAVGGIAGPLIVSVFVEKYPDDGKTLSPSPLQERCITTYTRVTALVPLFPRVNTLTSTVDNVTGVGWQLVFLLTAAQCAFTMVLWYKYQTSDYIPELNTPGDIIEEDNSFLSIIGCGCSRTVTKSVK